MSELKLAGFLARSTVNGPGTRAVVWVQGCPLRCEGCFNPGFLPFSNGRLVHVEVLAKKILALDRIDGVTFSGGEPFAQALPLAELGTMLREAGLSVVTFTGFTVGQLAAKNRPAWQNLLSVTDLLIAGPYRPEKTGGPDCRTSDRKQIVRLCGGRPVGNPADYPLPNRGAGNEIEFTIRPDGRFAITGFPGSRLVEELVSHSFGE